MRRTLVVTGAGAAALLLHADVCGGPVWCEGMYAREAGSLPLSSQVTTGAGPLTAIMGRLNGSVGDFEDMYKIKIDDPMNFSASTSEAGVAGTSGFDTQLWLFDQNGFGLLANNDAFGMSKTGSLIESPATDGTGQIIPAPGIYYLAITGFGNDALSPGGPIFQIIADEISGPDGPGGPFQISGWTGGELSGPYLIHLHGASFAEIPAPGGLAALCAALLAPRMRRRSDS